MNGRKNEKNGGKWMKKKEYRLAETGGDIEKHILVSRTKD